MTQERQQPMLAVANTRMIDARVKPLIRIACAMALAFLLSQAGLIFKAPMARASSYSCGSPTSGSGHCYAIISWDTYDNGVSVYPGSSTAIFVVSIAGGNGFLNNETWLESLPPKGVSNCNNNNFLCWVETGYTDSPGQVSGITYFWADNRYNGGYHAHYVIGVPSGDFNAYTTFTITQDVNASTTWHVTIQSNNMNYVGNSTSNQMSPDNIDIGSELAGSGGAWADAAYLTDNKYQDPNRNWHYETQSKNYDYTLAPPPYETWFQNPNSSNGGMLETYCC